MLLVRRVKLRRSLVNIGSASLVAAALTWALQALAGRILGVEGYGDFMVLWGFLFAIVGLLQGVQQEVTRVVSSRQPAVPRARSSHFTGTIVIAVLGAAAVMLSSPWWGARLFGSHGESAVLAMAVAFVLYSTYHCANGVIAGTRRWDLYASLILAEGVLRFCCVLAVLLLHGSSDWQAWALVCGGVAWMGIIARRRGRAELNVRVSVSVSAFLRGSWSAMLASGCSAVLVAGFPVLLELTSPGPLDAEAGVVLAVVVMTRAPLLLTLNAYQGVLVTHFVEHRESIPRRLASMLVLVAVVTTAAGALAFGFGPALLRMIYGDGFAASGLLFGGLLFAAGFIAMLTLSGYAVLAGGRHRIFMLGWVVATLAVVGLLTIDASVGVRTVIALCGGPAIGLAVHVGAVLFSHRQSAYASSGH